MVKEKVKYIDGTEHEIEVFKLGFRKANKIAKDHIPLNDLSFGENKTIHIKGDIDMLGMKETALSTIKGLDLDKLESSEANRLYSTYFEKDIMGSLGQGGNPN